MNIDTNLFLCPPEIPIFLTNTSFYLLLIHCFSAMLDVCLHYFQDSYSEVTPYQHPHAIITTTSHTDRIPRKRNYNCILIFQWQHELN